MINSIKIFLWKCGLLKINRCPLCGSRMKGHGYDDCGQSPGYWTCNANCEFNENG